MITMQDSDNFLMLHAIVKGENYLGYSFENDFFSGKNCYGSCMIHKRWWCKKCPPDFIEARNKAYSYCRSQFQHGIFHKAISQSQVLKGRN